MTLRECILNYSGIIKEDGEENSEASNSSESYLDDLKKLISGELVASLQYLLAYKAIEGKENLSYMQDHLKEHSDEEKAHYEELADALMQRGGHPELNLSKMISNALPKTEEMTDYSVESLRSFFERAEDNAIKAYQDFYDKIEEKDKDLADIVNGIISDERDHRLDFQKIK